MLTEEKIGKLYEAGPHFYEVKSGKCGSHFTTPQPRNDSFSVTSSSTVCLDVTANDLGETSDSTLQLWNFTQPLYGSADNTTCGAFFLQSSDSVAIKTGKFSIVAGNYSPTSKSL
jgi:hypothetical protein